jgi:hypothetical protein
MEAIDHGPQFIKQLVACLLKYVAHQDTQQGSDGLTNTTTAALAAAAASGTAAVHTRMPLQEPLWEAGSQTERNGVNGAAAAAAAAAFNSTELGAAPAAAAGAGRLAVAASGGGGVEGRAARGLERWSRVPTAPTDGTMLDEALATAGETCCMAFVLLVHSMQLSAWWDAVECWCNLELAYAVWEVVLLQW